MFKNFDEVERHILSTGAKKRIALCGAHGEHALSALAKAHRKGVVDGTLVGDEKKIRAVLTLIGEDISDYEIINTKSDNESSRTAVSLLQEGKADIEMKGDLPSADFLLPIMNPFDGLVGFSGIMSACTAFYYPDQDRMVFVTDCALTIAPNLEEKVMLINNAVELARAFGLDQVKVAVISALERVNPQIPSTQDANDLSKMDWGKDIEVTGPLALDNALDKEMACSKGIESNVAGCADVLLMPDLCAGNIFHKCVHYLGHMQSAGVVCGTSKPVVFTSRSDSTETKYNSILSAILQSIALQK
jgi:phosphate butyryltransferase